MNIKVLQQNFIRGDRRNVVGLPSVKKFAEILDKEGGGVVKSSKSKVVSIKHKNRMSHD